MRERRSTDELDILVESLLRKQDEPDLIQGEDGLRRNPDKTGVKAEVRQDPKPVQVKEPEIWD